MSNTCPSCGEVVKPTDVFCPFCSYDLKASQSASSSASSALICANCGASNDLGVNFCQSCGQPLESPKAPQEPIDSQGQQESYDYGSYSETSSTGERKWYSPPKRQRSAKHPIEWLFWIGWSLYILLRVFFQIFWCVAIIAGRRR